MGGTALEIQSDTAGVFVILRLAGEVDLSTAGQLGAAITAVMTSGEGRAVVLDFGQVSFCDSSGLRELITGWKMPAPQAGSSSSRMCPSDAG